MAKSKAWMAYLAIGAIVYFIFFSSGGYGNTSNNCNPVWNADHNYDSVTFCSLAEAISKADEVGCSGYHTHTQDGQTIYMACSSHEALDPYVNSNY